MTLYPDYGLFLLGQGCSRELRNSFYDFPLDKICILGLGRFTTMKNLVFGGIEYAVSLDFDRRILTNILNGSPSCVVECVEAELSRDAAHPRTIQLPQTLALGIETAFGTLQRALDEQFVPFVILTVFRAQPVSPEEMMIMYGWSREENGKLTNSLVRDDIPGTHIIAFRADVERCNVDPTLGALTLLRSDPETALRFQNNVTLTFEGYDEDSRGLFEIEEVRVFVAELNKGWYPWFFFMTKDIRTSPLGVIALCLCRYTRSGRGLFIPVVQIQSVSSGSILEHCVVSARFVAYRKSRPNPPSKRLSRTLCGSVSFRAVTHRDCPLIPRN